MIESADANPLRELMKQKGDNFSIVLPATMDGASAATFADALLSARSHPLTIDASAVERIDTPCIQILLAAAKQWSEEGVELSVTAQSEAFSENLATLGLGGFEGAGATELDLGAAIHG